MMPALSSPEWSSVGGKFRRRFPQLKRGPKNRRRSGMSAREGKAKEEKPQLAGWWTDVPRWGNG